MLCFPTNFQTSKQENLRLKGMLGRDDSKMLAQDALHLMEHVWGPQQRVHLLGISMGGMVAQMLGCLLAERGRLASLTLAVSAASMWRHPMHLPFCLCRHILAPNVIHSDPRRQVPTLLPTHSPSLA